MKIDTERFQVLDPETDRINGVLIKDWYADLEEAMAEAARENTRNAIKCKVCKEYV